jgi:hypothetical protein
MACASSSFFRSPTRKKLEQMYDFKQQPESLTLNHEAARCPVGSIPRIVFIPLRFSDIEISQIGGAKPRGNFNQP